MRNTSSVLKALVEEIVVSKEEINECHLKHVTHFYCYMRKNGV